MDSDNDSVFFRSDISDRTLSEDEESKQDNDSHGPSPEHDDEEKSVYDEDMDSENIQQKSLQGFSLIKRDL
jgi:hypothetical protein